MLAALFYHVFYTTELAIPTEILTKEALAGMETYPVTVEVSVPYNLKSYKNLCASYLLSHFALFLL